MSVLTCNDQGLLRPSRKVKDAARDHKRQVKKMRKRIRNFLRPAVNSADRSALAEVFVTEQNALLLCEQYNFKGYKGAIGLLLAQEYRNASVAADALERLWGEGALVVR